MVEGNVKGLELQLSLALNPGPGLSLTQTCEADRQHEHEHGREPKQRLHARSGRGRVVEWNVKGLELQLPL